MKILLARDESEFSQVVIHVVGSHGHGRLERLLLGSVKQYVEVAHRKESDD